MIRISNLNKQFGSQILFTDVNISIHANEKIGLIGRNGTGKSTFLKILQELDTSCCEIETTNAIIIRALEQNLNFSHQTLLQQVSSAIPNYTEADTWRAEAILMGLGFNKEDFSKHPKEFSSGFQIRIRLAESLIAESDLLLLDEPTNYLDIISLRWLVTFLKNWKKGFILVTHDRSFMEQVVTHTIGIHRQKMRKMKGGPQKLLDQIKLEEEVYEKTRQNQLKKKAKTEDFIRKFRAGARSAGLVQSRIKALEKQDIGEALEEIPEIIFKFHWREYQGNHLIKCEDLSFEYESNNLLIKNLTLDTYPGDKIAVIGKNGRGKSTLLKILRGLLEPTTGTIKINPTLKIGYFGQDTKEALFETNNILEEFGTMPGITDQEARKMCAMLLFRAEEVKKKISFLSGGEKSRISLGKAILATNQILILDEPTNHLDLESAQALIKAMKEFKGLIIFVTHDESMIHEVANRLIVFDHNQTTVYNENYAYFLKNKGWSDEDGQITKTQNLGAPITNKKSHLEARELKKKQNQLEKQIAKLEKQEYENGQHLHEACMNKEHLKIKELGEKAKNLHDQIHLLYEELEKIL